MPIKQSDYRPDLDKPDSNGDNVANDVANPAEQMLTREQAVVDQMEKGLQDDQSPEGAALRAAAEEHAAATNPMNYSDSKSNTDTGTAQQTARKLTSLLRKRYGVIGLITTLGVSGGLLAAFFGPASMLINLSQNFTETNDTSSTVLERRVFKIINEAFNADSADLCTASNKVRCKGGRFSNRTLRNFAKNGMTAGFMRDGKFVPMELGRSGFSSEVPTHFEMDDGGNKIVKTSKEMPDFVKESGNRKYQRSIYGRYGAFNMRTRAWSGKHIKTRFIDKFLLTRAGGIVAKDMKGLKANERVQKATQKFTALNDKINSLGDTVKTRVSNKVSKAGKAGPAYAVAIASCAAVKAPKYVGAGVAALQIIELVNLFNDRVLGPGTAAQMGGIDEEIEFTGEDADIAGTLLTQTTAREEDGKLTSALDSPYLLTALGVSNLRLPISAFAPGYSVMQNPALKFLDGVDDAFEPACNFLMAPGTMYTMMAADGAVTLAASATVLGAVAKIGVSWAISSLASAAGGWVVGQGAELAIAALANTDMISTATGERLGDAIGIGATAFFASGAMSRFLPGLSVAGKASFDNIRRDQIALQREMDIAALSPFDISSQYTFLGSIVHNLRNDMLRAGYLNNSARSILANIIRLPATALSFSKTVNADTAVSPICYGEEFGLNTTHPDKDPCITMSGLPLTGMTEEMDRMTYREAYDILAQRGWIDTSIEVPEDAITDDLLELGFIVPDTPMTDYMDECGDSSTGQYLLNSAGCVISNEEMTNANDRIDSELQHVCVEENDQTVCYTDATLNEEFSGNPDDTPDFRSMTAVVIFLVDYQARSIVSGEDDEQGGSTAASGTSSGGGEVIPLPSKDGWSHPMPGSYVSFGYRAVGSKGIHKGIDFSYGSGKNDGKPVYAAHDGVVSRSWNMGSCGWATVITAPGTGVYHAYQHMDPIVKQGDTVKRGQQIGVVGKFCGSGKHLHFSIETANRVSAYADSGRNDTSRDPKDYLPL